MTPPEAGRTWGGPPGGHYLSAADRVEVKADRGGHILVGALSAAGPMPPRFEVQVRPRAMMSKSECRGLFRSRGFPEPGMCFGAA
jgi:hypothetical protein